MSSNTPTLILLLLDRSLAAWLTRQGEVPRDQPIEGEGGWFPCKTPDELIQALDDLRGRLGNELGSSFQLELLHDEGSRELLTKALPKLATPLTACAWEILRWEPLAARCGWQVDTSTPPSRDWIVQHALPLLLASDDASARRQMQEGAQREHASLTEQLQAERVQIQRENDKLRAQNEALRRVDAERLIVYLPALFPRVFTVIGGQDLALLTGRPEPYALPNPYPEPSPETLDTLQHDFRALPRELQRQVVAFISRLPQSQKLKPRPEMRALVQGLTEE
jgi:hypothetical protein